MAEQKPLIMVVDDDALNLDAVLILLKPTYEVVAVHSGAEALARACKQPQPDLILMDVMMPGMDGYEVCTRLKEDASTRTIPVIFLTAMDEAEEESKGLEAGGVDYILKPTSRAVLLSRLQLHLDLLDQNRALEHLVQQRTAELERSRQALRSATQSLAAQQVSPGVYWLQIPEANLRILCGCPGEVVKHLIRKGFINPSEKNGVAYETGPNAILLSDVLIQNRGFANLSEFPILQMLYRQGMIIPNHPNNTGVKPLLMGSASQVRAQLDYIHRGNYGLLSKEEIMACGVDEENAEIMMRIKLKFAFGKISTPEAFLDTLSIEERPVEIRDGVTVQRQGFNRFRFAYRDSFTDIDLNLPTNISYEPAYPLGHHRLSLHYFAVRHIGEGDGWDMDRPSMGSVMVFQGKVYLIDANPTVLHGLAAVGIDISEVEGVFQTHAHDDHFAGLPALIQTDRRLKYFSTPLVRSSVTKKFAALMSLDEATFGQFFDINDLTFDTWNDCDGLEVKPVYSPHPVENNMFVFRALDGEGYKTYAHWADLSSFKVLDGMVGEGEKDVPKAFMEQIKENYLQQVDLKKLDVGGGMIHGETEDFAYDASSRMILAHTSRRLSIREMSIGSERSFGSTDVLIPGHQDYLRQRAFHALRGLFPDVPGQQLSMLANGQQVSYNPGTLIHRLQEQSGHVDLILSGTIAFLDADAHIHNHLAMGSIIWGGDLAEELPGSGGTYRAVTYCNALVIPTRLFKAFLMNNQLLEHMRGVFHRVWFLRKSWLFGEQTTLSNLATIARTLQPLELGAGSTLTSSATPTLWLVKTGKMLILDEHGDVLESVGSTGVFGEASFLGGDGVNWRYRADEAVSLYRLEMPDLMNIPVLHWKMREIHERRLRLYGAVSKIPAIAD
uniref:Cyclic nucleotide-binding protein n=1 Tax=Magnetococcus massalia (strain MO-1) TaxID=451514 RepID=A0A1S7LGB7_MAGMO|nr:conserved protein of unknown function;[Signal transduction response regulator, receiver region ] [Candidatus Magnetococcus massalia]